MSSPSMFPAVIMAISYKINNSRYHTAYLLHYHYIPVRCEASQNGTTWYDVVM